MGGVKKKSGAQHLKQKRKRESENKVLSEKMKDFLSNKTPSKSELIQANKKQALDDNNENEQQSVENVISGTIICDQLEILVDDSCNSSSFQSVVTDGFSQDLPSTCDIDDQSKTIDDHGECFESGISPSESSKITIDRSTPDIPPPSHILDSRIVVREGTNYVDPSSLVGIKLSHEDKRFILKFDPCQPSHDILKCHTTKQQGNRNRYCSSDVFLHNNGLKRKWLSYSLMTNSLFCIPCLLFTNTNYDGDDFRGNQGNAFVSSTGFSNWKKQHERVRDHEASTTHRNAKIAEVLFHQSLNMENLLDKQAKENEIQRLQAVEANRELLERIVEVIFLLGKQGLAFRGNDENILSSSNRGNFLEVLELLSKYDSRLNSHLKKVRTSYKKSQIKGKKKKGRGSKVTFLSKRTQNKLIDIIGNQITEVIVDEIQSCIGWSIIVDTTPDISHKEQCSICVRIVSPCGKISEHILACKEALSVTAVGLFSVIIKVFETKEVSFDNLVAQTYDGASNMSGCYNGLQAIVKQKVGKHILYVHCYAHSLNLVLKDSVSDEGLVCTLFDNLGTLHKVVNRTNKIHKSFENAQKEAGLQVLTVKRLNTVRWNSRELCLNVLLQRYDILLSVLEKGIKDEDIDGKKRGIIKGLYDTFQLKDIIATALLFKEIFTITGPLNRYLQSVTMDFGNASALVSGAIEQIQQLREDYDRIAIKIKSYKNSSWDTELKRSCRVDNNTEPPEIIWKREVFYSVIDQVTVSLKSRFEQNKDIFSSISFFSPKHFEKIEMMNADDLAKMILSFCVNYHLDANECAKELLSFSKTFSKLHLLRSRITQKEDECLSDSDDNDDSSEDEEEKSEDEASDVERTNEKSDVANNSFHLALEVLADPSYHLIDAYPLLYKAYGIILAIPITSCSAERTFSVLKRVKSRLRSSMTQKRLESLLLMAIEKSILTLIDRSETINRLGRSSKELTKLLIR